MRSNRTVGAQWSIWYLSAILTLMSVVPELAGQAFTDDELHDRFELFTHCQPMELFVDKLSPHAARIGISRDSIQAAAESRIRSAQLYLADSNDPVPLLYIAVGVSEHAFSIRLSYSKWFYDPLSGLSFRASTRSNGGFGTHSGTPAFIMSYLSGLLDTFLADYLRVNEAACEKR